MATNNMINSPEPFALAIGGTNADLTAAAGGVIYSTASAMAINTPGTSGQILVSAGTSAPAWTTVPGVLVTWSTISAATLNAAISNGYIINDTSAACVITLPATAPIGSKIAFRGLATGMGFTITANTGQTIQFGNQTSSSAGSWGTTVATDGCDIECIVANSVWFISNAVTAGFTKV